MRTNIILFSLLCSVSALGQAKKAINKQLNAELIVKKHIYDSISGIHDSLQKELKLAKFNVFKSEDQLNVRKGELSERLIIVSNNFRLLNELGFDANTIIPSSEFLHMSSPQVEKEYRLMARVMYRPFQFSRVTAELNLTDLKLKQQNVVLQSKVREYDSLILLDNEALKRERNYFDSLGKAKEAYDIALVKCNDQINYIMQKSDALATKWYEVKKQQQEDRRKEYERELKELEARRTKQKSKNGFVAFVPPVISDEYDDTYDTEKPIFSTEVPLRKEDYESEPLDFSKAPEPFVNIDEIAEFPGGHAALSNYLKTNLKLPQKVVDNEISGKVYVRFVVSDTGEISDVKIQRGIPDCKECDEEAIRLVSAMPTWIPGKYNGKPAKTWYNLPVTFKIQ